jgi:hypothetical protein
MGAPGLAFETWDPPSKGQLCAVPFGSRTSAEVGRERDGFLVQAFGGSTQPSLSVSSANCANPCA